MDNSYRIKANVGIDQVLNVNLKQDVDLYEILSLKLKQENLYKLHSADYGVIVGRVLANDAFGVPNAKVSVFIPLSDEDSLRPDVRDIYPYKSVTDRNKDNVKYNTLPNYSRFECHQEVGSFPKKQLVLDDDSMLEVYDKYYRYTTITNNAGDYMIFGVPTGEQILHVDVDLSDIGILSQEPRDFIYKGYSPDLFESPTQFKKGTDLDNLVQIHNENVSVTVYPFWGDKSSNEIAITRKDINLEYKFETTCVFLGSVITDGGSNSISHNCIPDKYVGDASQLVPSKGNIEMIRKTIDDKVEEYPIKGNQLIDGDGTWCYQIPMNLDYVGMDEYGNIIPTNNPSKGIATRTRVRFRITLDETGDDSLTRHKARYLVPNNPDLYEGYTQPTIPSEVMDRDSYYEFGTLTPDDCFRDLYWNKVYSVKGYVPRLQMSRHEKSENYLAIKGINKKGAKENNPIPFNKLNLNFAIPAYYMLYNFATGNKGISGFWKFLKSNSVPFNVDAVREEILEDMDGLGLDFYNDWLNGCLYFPSWFWHIRQKKKYKKGESVYNSMICECKQVDDSTGQLYLYNNCSLIYDNQEFLFDKNKEHKKHKSGETIYSPFYNLFTGVNFGSKNFYSGIIKRKINKDDAEVFYYSFGNKLNNVKIPGNTNYDNNNTPEDIRPSEDATYYRYARLFSTDIILLGSLKDCDIDGVPKVSYNIPSTTANIPPIGRYKPDLTEWDEDTRKQSPSFDDEDIEENIQSHNGMNWGAYWFDEKALSKRKQIEKLASNMGSKFPYKYHLGSGLFFGLTSHKVYHGSDWALAGAYLIGGGLGVVVGKILGLGKHLDRIDIIPRSDSKTCINAERICELGVTQDDEIDLVYKNLNGSEDTYSFKSEMDGLITKREIEDIDSRAMFATLNNNKLIGLSENESTGYRKYVLTYLYPTNFDGRMETIAPEYTSGVTSDDRNRDYIDFRMGSINLPALRDNRQKGKFGNNREYSNRAETRGGTHNHEYTGYVFRGNNREIDYTVENGYITFNKYIRRRNRHFYGYDNTNDILYPEIRNREYFENYEYAFPLYNNSFYFYFGINQGSTAIDKFYEQFYSLCKIERESAFLMKVETSAATPCQENGQISVNVQEIEMPYSVTLSSNGTDIETFDNLNIYSTLFTGLPNGKYNIKVTDFYGNSMSEDILLKYQKITLSTTVERGITTEYRGQSCDEICRNDYYGKLRFDSYTLNGEEIQITSLNGNNGVYTVDNGKVTIEITPTNSTSQNVTFNDYICECTTPVIGNVINISVPGTFSIKVYQTDCSDNVGYYTVTISDTKSLEMYINNVPLKYIVGLDEDIIPYNKFFHGSGDAVTGVSDKSISGWFGVHNPSSYSNLFKYPMGNDGINEIIWSLDIESAGNLNIIKKKFEYMFNLSSAAYVTAGGKNEYHVDLDGGDGNLLIRSSFPLYTEFTSDNIEGENEFNSYITSEANSVICHEESPNIVSENYCKVNPNNYFPSLFGINGYEFNRKYASDNNRMHHAANYFAGFSNNANLTQIDEDVCEQNTNYKPYQMIPYKAHDLFKDGIGMCIYSERNEMIEKVYNQYRYFRTEFIDRRFDYDAFYVTGHRCIHFGEEEEAEWNMGRISALTYNGIEMAYDDKKNIISDEDELTEYSYNADDATISLNKGKKKFYESKLYYGDGKYVELINAYKSKKNTDPKACYFDNDGASIPCIVCGESSVDPKEFDNFGLDTSSEDVNGYPTKRWLCFNKIPYGDNYTFTNISCSYNDIQFINTENKITAKATKGETVTYDIEAGELINLVCSNDFATDCASGLYNIFYLGDGSVLTSKMIKKLQFRFNSNGSNGFRTKIEGLGMNVCRDKLEHDNLKTMKTGTTMAAVEGAVTDSRIVQLPVPDAFDTSEEFKNKLFSVVDKELNPRDKFINIIFDRHYYSQAKDSLLKRIRVLNTSTIYNVNDFQFSYILHDKKSDSFIIPEGAMEVESSGDLPEQDESTTDSQTVETRGTNTNEVESKRERDYTVFKFTSHFLSSCMGNICFNIDYAGDNANYFLTDNNVKVISQSANDMTIAVLWNDHKTLLEKNEEDATIKVYMKIQDSIKMQYGEGYMVFAFGFKIRGTGTSVQYLGDM